MTETTTGKSLLVPMLDFAAEFEDETNRWFDSDHVPERLSCAGIRSCERFQLFDVEPLGWTPAYSLMKYLNLYELDSTDVLTSDAYALQRDMNDKRGSIWRQERAATYARAGRVSPSRSVRSAWVQRPSPWAPLTGKIVLPAPRTLLVMIWDVLDDARRDEVNRYIDDEYVPELITSPGIVRCERYERDYAATLSSAEGRDRNELHSRYFDIYDLTTPEVVTSPQYRQLITTPSAVGRHAVQHMAIEGMGVYLQRPSPWLTTVR